MIGLIESQNNIELSNAVHINGYGRDWPVVDLSFYRLPGDQPFTSNLSWIEIDLSVGKFAIGQSEALFDELVNKSNNEFDAYSKNIQTAILTDLLDQWLSCLEEVAGNVTQFNYMGTSPLEWTDDPNRDVFRLNFEVKRSGVASQNVALIGDNSVKPILHEFLKTQSSPARNVQVPDGIGIPLFLRIGMSVITRKECMELQIGDVVLIESLHCNYKSEVCLYVGSRHKYKAKYNGRGEIVMSQNQEEVQLEEISEKEHSTSEVSQVALKLDFDIGQAEISYSELANIKTGHVFDLGKQLTTGVNIRSGWHVVAKGELIDIGGHRIGVRISELPTLMKES